MKLNSFVATAVLAGIVLAGLAACEKEGPAERAGKAIDKAGQQAVDKAKEVGKEAGDKVKDAVK